MNEYIHKVLELFSKGNVSDEAKQEFHNWLVDDEFADEKEDALFDLWNTSNEITNDEAVQSFNRFNNTMTTVDSSSFQLRVILRYAALIVAVIGIAAVYIFTHQPQTPSFEFVEFYSEAGDVRSILLPDGSKVAINSSTVLIYPEDFGENSRSLYLLGEANFKVAKHAKLPFIVQSKQFAITALGTEFNVSSYPDDDFYNATLINGSIKVEDENENIEHILEVGQQFSYNKNSSSYLIRKADLEEVTAWQRGELILGGSTVEEILNTLQRHYDVVIYDKRKDKNSDKYNFRFESGASLSKVFDVIEKVTGFKIHKLQADVFYIR